MNKFCDFYFKNWGGKEVVGLHVFNYKNGHANFF